LPNGATYIEYAGAAGLNGIVGAAVKVKARTVPTFYSSQPSSKLLEFTVAKAQSQGKGIVVADIDSLVDYSHPALKGHLTTGYDFIIGATTSTANLNQSSATFLDQSSATFLDQSSATFLDQSSATFLDQSSATFLDATNPAHGHATLVEGIIAAWAPQCMIMPLRAFDDAGQTTTFIVAKSIRYAVDQGADVINMSFGLAAPSITVQNAINYAASKNVVLVASAGNDNVNQPQYPAAYTNVISVAATDLNDMKAPFSNYGSSVFVSAPGVNVIAPYPGGHYAAVSGTSFAAPSVAALAALILDKEKTTASGVKDYITRGAVNINQLNGVYAQGLGVGRIDLFKSIR
jgi:subtilisin family serine protease